MYKASKEDVLQGSLDRAETIVPYSLHMTSQMTCEAHLTPALGPASLSAPAKHERGPDGGGPDDNRGTIAASTSANQVRDRSVRGRSLLASAVALLVLLAVAAGFVAGLIAAVTRLVAQYV